VICRTDIKGVSQILQIDTKLLRMPQAIKNIVISAFAQFSLHEGSNLFWRVMSLKVASHVPQLSLDDLAF
jgi:hypothetical protein